MIFRQLFDATSGTYTYLLGDEGTATALLIDPVFEQFARDEALIRELGLTLKLTLETHVHADHVTAAWLFKQELDSEIVVSEATHAEGADRLVHDGDVVRLGAIALEVRQTPGHTDGCVSYVTADHAMAFTGDSLMIRSAGRTDFQQGDPHVLYRSVTERLFTLPDACIVYPGHDYKGRTSTTIGEEKAHNPRLGGQTSEADFIGFMSNLGLPHPKQMAQAVPANLSCGRPDGADASFSVPAWAPVHRSFAGALELDCDWLAEHPQRVYVVDVREPAEFTGELGHVRDAHLVPLGELRSRLAELPRDRPVVTICRSGGRSVQAALILEGAGFAHVASMRGGMIRWRAHGLPVA